MKSAVPCTGQAYLNAGGPFRPNCGIIYPVSACEPQAKHEFSGIDTMFLSEHERYPKCELGNMAEQEKLLKKGGRAACPPCL